MKRPFDSSWRRALYRGLASWTAKLSARCSDMARLASESLDRELTWRESWRMRVHSWICHGCRRYARHLKELHRLAPLLISKSPQIHRRSMPPETRERLKRKLRSGGRE